MLRNFLIILLLCPLVSNVVGQTLSFENGIPLFFKSDKDSKLSISDDYFKDGKKSLKWEFMPGDKITVGLKDELRLNDKTRNYSGIYFWVYNEKAEKDSLTIEFLTPDARIAYRFSYRLFSKGWRACWIGFKHMEALLDSESIASYRIVAPLRRGKVYIDRLTFPVAKVNDRTTPDYQMPYNNSMNNRDLWHWCRVWQWEQYKYDIALPSELNQKQQDDLNVVETRLDNYLQLNKKYEKQIQNAYTVLKNSAIHSSKKGFVGKPLVAPDERNKKAGELIWEDIETMLAGFAYDVLLNGSKTSLYNYFLVWNYAIDQGFAWGSGMGTNHHYGYQVKDIYITAWLMRDYIKASSIGKEIMDALTFWSALQETRQPCQEGRDELLDSWHTLLQPKLIAAMMQTDQCHRYRAMLGLSRWLSTSLRFTPGTIGGIKVDGSTFHHGGFYPAYTTGVLARIGMYTHLTDNTEFEPTYEAKQVLKSAFLAMRNYSNLYEWGIGLGGRHPFDGKIKQDDIDAFAYLALAGDLSGRNKYIDYELAADYLRLCRKNTAEKKFFESKGIKPAIAPQGMFVYNYGAAGIYRRKDWMVTLKGFNTDVWGSEIYKKDNRYGRYQSYGSVQIFNGLSRKESGYDENGWDWNRLPGTTTIHLPFDLLEAPSKGTMMVHSHENFAGSSSLNGEAGIFGIKLMERNFRNFTPDFVARKSVFCLGNRLICLGSGISNSNKDYPTETTLFQCIYPSPRQLKMDGESIGQMNYKKSMEASSENIVRLEDGYGNIYYLKDGCVTLQISNQTSLHEKTREMTSGTFASAWISHGLAPQNEGYEYVVCIEPEKQGMEQPLSTYRVVQKDNKAHIIEDYETGINAYVAFDSVNLDDDPIIKGISSETMVMQKFKHGQLIMSVCDPNLNISEKTYTTKEPSRIIQKQIVLRGKWEKIVDNEKVTLHCEHGITKVNILCQHGIPIEFQLMKK